jgi:hypothetical protein
MDRDFGRVSGFWHLGRGKAQVSECLQSSICLGSSFRWSLWRSRNALSRHTLAVTPQTRWRPGRHRMADARRIYVLRKSRLS